MLDTKFVTVTALQYKTRDVSTSLLDSSFNLNLFVSSLSLYIFKMLGVYELHSNTLFVCFGESFPEGKLGRTDSAASSPSWINQSTNNI